MILGQQCPIGFEDRFGFKKWLGHISFSNKKSADDSAYVRLADSVALPSPSSLVEGDFLAEHISLSIAFADRRPSVKEAHLTSASVHPKTSARASRIDIGSYSGVVPLVSTLTSFAAVDRLPSVAEWNLLGEVPASKGARFASANEHAKKLLSRAIAEHFNGRYMFGWLSSANYFPALSAAQQSSATRPGSAVVVGLALVAPDFPKDMEAVAEKVATLWKAAPSCEVRWWLGPTPFGPKSDWRFLAFHTSVDGANLGTSILTAAVVH